MKKYLEDLRVELKKTKMNDIEIADIIADYEEMLRSAVDEGLDEVAILKKFGQPEHVAKELSEQANKETFTAESASGYLLWKQYPIAGESQKATVHLVSEDVIVQPSEGDDFQILYRGDFQADRFEVNYESGEFSLRSSKKSGWFGIGFGKQKLELLILVPKNVKLTAFVLVTINGDVKILGVSSDETELKTTNGDAFIQGGSLGKMKVSTVNGDTEYLESALASLQVSQISGDMKMGKTNISGNMQINTVSGDTLLTQVECGEFDVRSVSGDVTGDDFYPQTLVLKSVSGDISILNSENRGMMIKQQRSVSGEITVRLK